MSDDDRIELGGNIELSGFRDVDGATMIVLKKIIGSYARKFSDTCKKFESLSVTMKKVHEREISEKYEIHVKLLDNGKPLVSEVTDFNMFFAIDTALKKVENEIQHD